MSKVNEIIIVISDNTIAWQINKSNNLLPIGVPEYAVSEKKHILFLINKDGETINNFNFGCRLLTSALNGCEITFQRINYKDSLENILVEIDRKISEISTQE
ncbi:MAG: hypothetical protein HGA61_00330 [Candidatus Moranbacteria bacterium]|nr:hypothetical protein [Candidatus Moranbacteria bacterium]